MKPILLSLATLSLIACSKSDEVRKSKAAKVSEQIASDKSQQENPTGTVPASADGNNANNVYEIVVTSGLALVEEAEATDDPMADSPLKGERGNKGKGKENIEEGDEAVGTPSEDAKKDDAAQESAANESEDLAPNELAQCSAHFGVPTEGIKISGRGETVEVAAADIVALKVTGTTNGATVSLASDNPETVASLTGICLVLMGNESQVSVNLAGVSLGSTIVIARGASEGAVFNLSADSEIKEWTDDIGGSATATSMTGDGVYPEPIIIDRSPEKDLEAMPEEGPGKAAGNGKGGQEK